MPLDDRFAARLGLVLVVLFAQSIIVFAQSESDTQLDLLPPQIEVVAPQEGTINQDGLPRIEVIVIDLDSGVREEGLMISVDGIDVTAAALLQGREQGQSGSSQQWVIYYRPSVPLSPGMHLVRVEAVDLAGNRSRKQWTFFVQREDLRGVYSFGLVNSANYSFFPLRRLKNISNIALGLSYPQSKLQITATVGATDYWNSRAKLNFGGLFFTLDKYALDLQMENAAFQYGHIGSPMESRLLQFGPNFKGSVLEVGNPLGDGDQLRVFRGTAGGSLGLGVSTTKLQGGWYERRSGQTGNAIYLVGLDGGERRAIGFQDKRVIEARFLFSEIVYGQNGEVGGAGLRTQVAAPWAGIFWDGELILLQGSFPLASTAFLSYADGGGYRGSITGTRTYKHDTVLGFGLSREADNLRGSEPETRTHQTMHLNLAGTLGSNVDWHMAYQGVETSYYGKTTQQLGRLSLRWRGEDAWNTTLTVGSTRQDAVDNKNRRYQWDVGRHETVEWLGLNTTYSLRYSREEGGKNEQKDSLRIRFAGEKILLEDLLIGSMLVEFRHNRQDKMDLSARTTLSAEGTFNFTPGENHLVQLNGRLSFWRDHAENEKRGLDYSLKLFWRATIL